jgi:hypothetical protein
MLEHMGIEKWCHLQRDLPLYMFRDVSIDKSLSMLNMHRAKPSLREGMESWLDILWVCNLDTDDPHLKLPILYINEKWHNREFFLLYLRQKNRKLSRRIKIKSKYENIHKVSFYMFYFPTKVPNMRYEFL